MPHDAQPTRLNGKFRRSNLGCDYCRTQRKKCDEQRPSCSYCLRAGKTCNYTSLAERQRRFRQRAAAAQARGVLPCASMALDWSAFAVRLFQDNHPAVRSANGSRDLPMPIVAFSLLGELKGTAPVPCSIPSAAPSSLGIVAEAYALLRLSLDRRDVSMYHRALLCYSKGCRAVAQGLRFGSVEILAACFLMPFFELATPRVASLVKFRHHTAGLQSLLEHLPPDASFGRAAWNLIKQARRLVIEDHLGPQRPALPTKTGMWDPKNLPFAKDYDMLVDRVVVEAVETKAAAEMWSPLDTESVEAILQRTQLSLQRLEGIAKYHLSRAIAGDLAQWRVDPPTIASLPDAIIYLVIYRCQACTLQAACRLLGPKSGDPSQPLLALFSPSLNAGTAILTSLVTRRTMAPPTTATTIEKMSLATTVLATLNMDALSDGWSGWFHQKLFEFVSTDIQRDFVINALQARGRPVG